MLLYRMSERQEYQSATTKFMRAEIYQSGRVSADATSHLKAPRVSNVGQRGKLDSKLNLAKSNLAARESETSGLRETSCLRETSANENDSPMFRNRSNCCWM